MPSTSTFCSHCFVTNFAISSSIGNHVRFIHLSHPIKISFNWSRKHKWKIMGVWGWSCSRAIIASGDGKTADN